MDKLFLTILNMSLTGAFVIAAICLVRLPLKKVPKIISYCLWAVAGFRLAFPFSSESVFSLLPFNAQTIPPDIAMQAVPKINSGIPYVNSAVSSVLPAATPYAGANPLQIWIAIGAFVWIIGVAVLFFYGTISFLMLKRKMKAAVYIEKNIYEAENIKTPFVLGVFKPKIYLPIGLSEQEKSYIILHEQTHIKRRDHIVRLAAYFVLCLHWFNPLAWIAFMLMGVDMEMSCDERVLKEMGGDIRKDYSLLLLSLATERRFVGGNPPAFGEGGIKGRIKNVLNFKRPSRMIIFTAVVLVAALSIGLAVNRMSGQEALINRLIFERGAWQENRIEPDTVLMMPGEISQQNIRQKYFLEDVENNAHFTKMTTVTLFNDNTVTLATPPISSYLLPPCVYSLEENELMIYASIDTSELESAYGVKSGDAIAVFTVDTDGALVFKSATVPLFADQGARYILAPSAPATDFPLREWVSYDSSEDFWNTTSDIMLEEFPDVMFSWTWGKVTATDSNGVKDFFTGMPIWNVYLADLNGDGLPEFCATVSFGSGIIDTRVIVCDYANDRTYELSDRMAFDYALSM